MLEEGFIYNPDIRAMSIKQPQDGIINRGGKQSNVK